MRFLNADPIGFSGGSNWFACADGNPISLSDPFGLCAERAGQFASDFGQGLADYTWSDMGEDIGGLIREVNYNMPLEALGPNPAMFFEGLVLKSAQAANNAVPTKQSALAKPLQTLFGTMLKMEPRCSSFHRIFTMRQGIQEELS
jgi:hypothetical protein